MKILLDENLPHDLRHFLPGHDVFTAAYMAWSGLRNGELMAKAAEAGFNVMLSLDAGLEYEQNPTSLPIAVVKIRCKSNKLVALMPLIPNILESLRHVQPCTLVTVP